MKDNTIVSRDSHNSDLSDRSRSRLQRAIQDSIFMQLPEFEFEVVQFDSNGHSVIQETKKNRYFREELGNGVFLDMVYIPGGRFKMGTHWSEDAMISWLENLKNPDFAMHLPPQDFPSHLVKVPSFLMGRFPVTQMQWTEVSKLPEIRRKISSFPSLISGRNFPVEGISWDDAMEFCDRLSKITNRQYRLPSESEWEYACRAGTNTKFHFGDTVTRSLANCTTEFECFNPVLTQNKFNFTVSVDGRDIPQPEQWEESPIEVGSLKVANNLGLCDMHGGVLEWCSDHFHHHYHGHPTDGSAWIDEGDQNARIVRGGSRAEKYTYCSSSTRGVRYLSDPLDDNFVTVGLRVVCSNLDNENFTQNRSI